MKRSTVYKVSAGLWLACFFINLSTFFLTKGPLALVYLGLCALNAWLYLSNKAQARMVQDSEDRA